MTSFQLGLLYAYGHISRAQVERYLYARDLGLATRPIFGLLWEIAL
jgi:hypothetical protein